MVTALASPLSKQHTDKREKVVEFLLGEKATHTTLPNQLSPRNYPSQTAPFRGCRTTLAGCAIRICDSPPGTSLELATLHKQWFGNDGTNMY